MSLNKSFTPKGSLGITKMYNKLKSKMNIGKRVRLIKINPSYSFIYNKLDIEALNPSNDSLIVHNKTVISML